MDMPALAPVALAGITAALLAWWIGDLLGGVRLAARSVAGEGPPPNVVDTVGLRTPVAFVVERFGPSFAGPAADVDRKLVYAGRPFGGISGAEYVALFLVVGVFGFVLFAGLFGLASGSLLGGLVAGCFFGALPPVYLWLMVDDRVQNRTERLSREFPYFLDLVVMTQQAQATLPESLRLYAEAAPGTIMTEEVEQTLKDVALGTGLIEALQRLEARIKAEEVIRVIRAVIQGELEGSNRLELLREHAKDLRFRRWEKADRASETLKAKIVMPAMLIVVSILLLVLAPAIVEMTTNGMF